MAPKDLLSHSWLSMVEQRIDGISARNLYAFEDKLKAYQDWMDTYYKNFTTNQSSGRFNLISSTFRTKTKVNYNRNGVKDLKALFDPPSPISNSKESISIDVSKTERADFFGPKTKRPGLAHGSSKRKKSRDNNSNPETNSSPLIGNSQAQTISNRSSSASQIDEKTLMKKDVSEYVNISQKSFPYIMIKNKSTELIQKYRSQVYENANNELYSLSGNECEDSDESSEQSAYSSLNSPAISFLKKDSEYMRYSDFSFDSDQTNTSINKKAIFTDSEDELLEPVRGKTIPKKYYNELSPVMQNRLSLNQSTNNSDQSSSSSESDVRDAKPVHSHNNKNPNPKAKNPNLHRCRKCGYKNGTFKPVKKPFTDPNLESNQNQISAQASKSYPLMSTSLTNGIDPLVQNHYGQTTINPSTLIMRSRNSQPNLIKYSGGEGTVIDSNKGINSADNQQNGISQSSTSILFPDQNYNPQTLIAYNTPNLYGSNHLQSQMISNTNRIYQGSLPNSSSLADYSDFNTAAGFSGTQTPIKSPFRVKKNGPADPFMDTPVFPPSFNTLSQNEETDTKMDINQKSNSLVSGKTNVNEIGIGVSVSDGALPLASFTSSQFALIKNENTALSQPTLSTSDPINDLLAKELSPTNGSTLFDFQNNNIFNLDYSLNLPQLDSQNSVNNLFESIIDTNQCSANAQSSTFDSTGVSTTFEQSSENINAGFLSNLIPNSNNQIITGLEQGLITNSQTLLNTEDINDIANLLFETARESMGGLLESQSENQTVESVTQKSTIPSEGSKLVPNNSSSESSTSNVTQDFTPKPNKIEKSVELETSASIDTETPISSAKTGVVGLDFSATSSKSSLFKTPAAGNASIIPEGVDSPPEIESDEEILEEHQDLICEMLSDLPEDATQEMILKAQKKAIKKVKRMRNPNLLPTPQWANTPSLLQQLKDQQGVNPDSVFGEVKPIKIDEIFKSKRFNASSSRLTALRQGDQKPRNSSGIWSGPDLLSCSEIEEYNATMGYKSDF
ncbi:hypothetical protein BB560_004918 [Smittium megazygosporum]|uniref:Inner centromere protein ARK-binding domain-containing protein n=1 Tax=Smittium megazygosporum TaxID=133381 RepID=A0A2T9Z7W8_9FUNG|nr:hypothetical protein BB560_004918 [Smittium megazygosporum]